jgi:hypothetical protein
MGTHTHILPPHPHSLPFPANPFAPFFLFSAYMNNEIRDFEKILEQNSRSVMGDAFIKLYLDDLLKNIRTQASVPVFTVGATFTAHPLVERSASVHSHTCVHCPASGHSFASGPILITRSLQSMEERLRRSSPSPTRAHSSHFGHSFASGTGRNFDHKDSTKHTARTHSPGGGGKHTHAQGPIKPCIPQLCLMPPRSR